MSLDLGCRRYFRPGLISGASRPGDELDHQAGEREQCPVAVGLSAEGTRTRILSLPSLAGCTEKVFDLIEDLSASHSYPHIRSGRRRAPCGGSPPALPRIPGFAKKNASDPAHMLCYHSPPRPPALPPPANLPQITFPPPPPSPAPPTLPPPLNT